MRFLTRKFFRNLVARVRSWTTKGSPPPVSLPVLTSLSTFTPSLHRDVTPNGVRFYNLCGCCGARLQASATLCDGCAQRGRPARPI